MGGRYGKDQARRNERRVRPLARSHRRHRLRGGLSAPRSPKADRGLDLGTDAVRLCKKGANPSSPWVRALSDALVIPGERPAYVNPSPPSTATIWPVTQSA